MRIIQAPRKSRSTKEKSAGKLSKSGTETRTDACVETHAHTGQRAYSARRPSTNEAGSKLKTTQSHNIDSADELNPLGYRSRGKDRGKDRGKIKKDVSVIHKSIELLARREHSVVELKQKLKTREYSEEEIEKAMEQLVRDGLVCDQRFTEAYVRHRTMRGFGPTKIAMELNSKGVSSLLIEEHVDAASSHWLDLALNTYTKKFGQAAPTTYAEWTKRARFLQGRGFNSSIIQNVCPSIEFD